MDILWSHSAIFEAIDIEALLICDTSPYISLSGNFDVILYMHSIKLELLFQTCNFWKLVSAII